MESAEEIETVVDLQALLEKGGQSAASEAERHGDVPLQWGDIVEFSQAPGSDPHAWTGFDLQTLIAFKGFLSRRIEPG